MSKTQLGGPLKWLAVTKFHPPKLHDDIIHRERLVGALYEAISSYPLTLLSAPAGYGKTTLLATLPTAYPEMPLAWLSLDEEDNDPVRFFSALITSLQQLNSDCGTTAQLLLAELSSAGFEARRVMSVLINDIQDTLSDKFTLLIEDLHLIVEPSIFVALDYLLERVPPQTHLVVSSRTEPALALARLRARGKVVDLYFDDLRFTGLETKAFLNDGLGLGLTLEDLDSLQSRTEGWPAGLRLLAGSLGHIASADDRNAFMQHFTRSERYVFDFLAEEVLNRQEPEVRSFLLQTAILPELTAALCRAITGRADAQTVLEELYRRNLFMVASDQSPDQAFSQISTAPVALPAAPPSFRYHTLFAEFLRHRLQQVMPERVPELHFLAAQAETIPSRAIGHYLAAAKWDEAAEMIEQVEHEALKQGFLDMLSSWINALPGSVVNGHPRLIHILGSCSLQRGELVTAQSMLERALASYERANLAVEQSEALADLASCVLLMGDLSRSETLYSRALTQAARPNTRLRVLMELASLDVFQERWIQAQENFATAVGLIQEPLDPELARTLVYHLVPGMVILPGAIDHMERFCRLADSLIGDEVSPMRVQIEGWMAVIHGWRGRWAEALLVNKGILAMNERLGGQPFAGIDAAAGLIAACGAIGAYEEAEPYYDLLFDGVKHMDFAEMFIAAFLFVPGRLLWMQGRLGEVRQVYEQMREAENPRELPMARVMRAWMQALLQAADGRYATAERTLRQPYVLEQKDRLSTVWGSTRLILARIYLEQNRQEEAMRELEIALPYYERMGWPGSLTVEGSTIVPLLQLAVEQDIQTRFASRLLSLLGANKSPEPVYVPQTGQTLTRREIEVLQLITAGATNQDIVDELVISMSTVKAHVSHILHKLDVSNRTQAASRAREWRLY